MDTNPPPPPPLSSSSSLLLSLYQDPLVEAGRLASILVRYASKYPETHILAYDVAMSRQKPLLALQALLRGKRLAGTPLVLPADLSYRIIQFFHKIKTSAPLHPAVAQVIK